MYDLGKGGLCDAVCWFGSMLREAWTIGLEFGGVKF